METNKLGKSIREIFNGQYKYIVPLYQRNFAWRRNEIEQLLQDIYEAYSKSQGYGNYYIGSLVVLKRANGDYEVIDGQQRLTTLSLITKILGINETPRLFYDSRPEVEEFFKAFYNSTDGNCNIDYPQTFHLKNAIDYIKETSLDASGKEDIKISDKDRNSDFTKYFANNVILVRVEIPQDTDVASYFEIMNNRGEQLQKHEILKSFLLNKLRENKSEKAKEFARIWDACSQMDIPIQKQFDAETRKRYFGDHYNDFLFDGLNPEEDAEEQTHKTISKILKSPISPQTVITDKEDEQDIDESIYKSIIDFPNFLMHIIKVMLQNPEIEIPLNEKYLLSKYNELKDQIDPEIFIKTLFFCRTIFDRYIVKTISDKTDNEDGEKWTLRKPQKNDDKWYYVDTFDNKDEQDRIVKALSMLQVTFRTRIYKNWLFEILKWFYDNNNINVEYGTYLNQLDCIILNNYNERALENKNIDKETLLKSTNSYSEGLKTPHFLFNFIDYLYWVDSKKETKSIKSSELVKPFDFKYWNSVEHHMAREWAERNKEKFTNSNYSDYIDNLGNLCLISRSANSRLSDRDAKEKAETFDKGNLGANRQVMYKITKDDGVYLEEQIKKHYNELLELLSKRKVILEYND